MGISGVSARRSGAGRSPELTRAAGAMSAHPCRSTLHVVKVHRFFVAAMLLVLAVDDSIDSCAASASAAVIANEELTSELALADEEHKPLDTPDDDAEDELEDDYSEELNVTAGTLRTALILPEPQVYSL